jgi:hypothetical protein
MKKTILKIGVTTLLLLAFRRDYCRRGHISSPNVLP